MHVVRILSLSIYRLTTDLERKEGLYYILCYDGSDEYQIYEYYEAYNLQTLLKMDFYRALGAGYVIRRCEC